MGASGRMGIKKPSESGIEAELDARPDFRVEVVGSTPTGPTTSRTGPARARIFAKLWELKKRGYSDITLEVKGERLRFLARHVDLDDPEVVKGYIASRTSWSNAYKQGVAYAYNSYAEVNGIDWSLPHFRVEDKLPKIPTEEKINQIIVRARGKYVLVFSILRDTGMRPIELERTRVKDIDLDTGVITVRTAKGGLGRTLKVKPQTLAMMKDYLGKQSFDSLLSETFPDVYMYNWHFYEAPNYALCSLYSSRIIYLFEGPV